MVMADPAKVAVYCDSYLTSSAANDLASSVFGTVVVPVHEAGDEMLRQNLQRLDGKNVLFAIKKRVDGALVHSAIRYYGVDGVDLELASIVLELADFVAAMNKLVVASPSAQPELWVEMLQASRTRMSWWNLQLYNGADYAAWVRAIVQSGVMTSERAQSFVVPGYKLTWSTPDSVALDLQGLKDYAPSVDGVFLRSYEQMKPRAAEWTRAIGSALGRPRTILAS
jgi:hypothetical protein